MPTIDLCGHSETGDLDQLLVNNSTQHEDRGGFVCLEWPCMEITLH